MITISKVSIYGFQEAIRGMRNPMNSWDKSDSKVLHTNQKFRLGDDCIYMDHSVNGYFVGPKDKQLMNNLCKAGPDHRKFMRMIVVYVDITAPFYWWKEFDTYKVGTVANSCSTMHKLTEKEFTLDDFSCEHLSKAPKKILKMVIDELNSCRNLYLNGGYDGYVDVEPKRKDVWWQMIQLLPSSYNQKRTVMLNYEVLANIYKSRKGHRLDEWHKFREWIETLPCSDLITEADNDE